MDLPEKHFEYPELYYNTQSAEQVMPILMEKFNPASLLDVGCGNGSWMQVAAKLGMVDMLGIDAQGPEQEKWPLKINQFQPVNLQEPFDLKRRFDMVLCLEVAEHLPDESAAVLIECLVRHSDLIIFSAAIPRQGGYMHINEQPPGYWQKFFNQLGYHTYDDIRPLIWDNEKIHWWYRQNIFIAQKATISQGRPNENILFLVHPSNYLEKESNRQMLADNKADLILKVNDWMHKDQSKEFHFRRFCRLMINSIKKRV